jgi:hypothetical protein
LKSQATSLSYFPSQNGDCPPLRDRRGFHEKAGRVNIFLSRPARNGRRRPTGGAT